MDLTYRVLEGDVVWISPELCELGGHPGGFALRIDAFLGVEGHDENGVPLVWVRGRWHDGYRWRREELDVRIAFNQPFGPAEFNAISAPAAA
jgi:hypothetical protein